MQIVYIYNCWASGMDQGVKALVAQSLVPSTHIVKRRELTLQIALLPPPHI